MKSDWLNFDHIVLPEFFDFHWLTNVYNRACWPIKSVPARTPITILPLWIPSNHNRIPNPNSNLTGGRFPVLAFPANSILIGHQMFTIDRPGQSEAFPRKVTALEQLRETRRWTIALRRERPPGERARFFSLFLGAFRTDGTRESWRRSAQ